MDKYRVVMDGKCKFNVEKKIRFRHWKAEQEFIINDPSHAMFLSCFEKKDKTFSTIPKAVKYIKKLEDKATEMENKGKVVWP